MSKSLRIQLEVDVHAVTCPGVWFHRKGPIFLSVCFLGYHVKTKPFPPTFPFLFGDKFVFEKTFPGCSTLGQLQTTLEQHPLYCELLQEHSPEHPPIVLATFETSGLEFLFPYPQLRPAYNSGVDVDLLMEPTREFPGVISPKIEASTRCHINETRHAHLDQLHDNAVTLNQVPPMDSHPHLGGDGPGGRDSIRRRHRSKSLDQRDPFAWRHVDDGLIGRTPDGDARPHVCDHGTRMRRSKSAVWGAGFRARHQSSDSGHSSSDERRGRSRDRGARRGHHHARPSSFYGGGMHHRRTSCSPTPPPPVHVHRDYHDHHPVPPSHPPSTVPIHNPPPPPEPQPPHPPPPDKPLPQTPTHHHPDYYCHPWATPVPPPPPPHCPNPYTCPYSCHVPEPPTPKPTQPIHHPPPHIHSKPRPVHYHHDPPYHPHHHHIHGHYHHGHLPCYGPCCAK